MFRLNGAYFYEGGAYFQAVRAITFGQPLHHAVFPVFSAEQWLRNTISAGVFPFRSSYAASQDVLEKLDQFRSRAESLIQSDPGQAVVGYEIHSLHAAINNFETLLKAELSISDFYLVTAKGCFDTTQLLTDGLRLFPLDLRVKVPGAEVDCLQAGKCIAFDLPTAAAFHLHRLNETVLRAYFSAVAPGVDPPQSKTIRAYVDAMKNVQLDNKVVRDALSSLNSLHRNPVMHPEQKLDSIESAIALWGSVNACVVHMLKEIPFPLPQLPLPNGVGSAL